MPKVSVIVPNYNHATYLRQRIDSILCQTFQDFELILLDDCSTDGSRDILSEYKNHPKVSDCLFNEQNSGSTFRQWEKGVAIAQGEYIWIAESDDWAESNFLETLILGIIEYSEVGIVYSASTLIDSEGNCTYQNDNYNTGEILFYSGKDFIEQKMLTSNSIWNASMMLFHKSLLTSILNHEYLEMKYSGDWLFYVQLARHTNVLEIRQTLNHYRIHAGNVSNNAKKTGKYFTEGFRVFTYISSIEGIHISHRVLQKWAKMYLKDIDKYKFDSNIREEILYIFYQYNPIINVYIFLGRFIYRLKNKK